MPVAPVAAATAFVLAVSAFDGHAQQSAGATDWFGRGIVRVSDGTDVQLELRAEAQGILLRLAAGEPIHIVAVGPFAAGSSLVRIPPPPPPEAVRVSAGGITPIGADDAAAARADIAARSQCVARQAAAKQPTSDCVSVVRQDPQARRATRATTVLRARQPEYLLLVLSDQPIDSTVTRHIGVIPGFDPSTAAHDVAEFLVGRRSPMWAGYLVRR